MNKVFLVAGGSGGHLFPALSVFEQLKNYDTLILTDKRTEKYLKKLGMKYRRILTARLKINFFLIFNLLKLFLSILDNIAIILKRKPDITKALNILNWEPKVSRKKGLENTLKYFRGLSLQELNKKGHKFV